MTAQLTPIPFYRDFDNQGNQLSFGSVYTYLAGTSTLTATYLDSTQMTPNTNPVQLNARGEAQIWLVPGQTYKFAVFDQYGNQIRIVDQIYAVQGLNALTQTIIGQLLYPQTPAEIAAGVTPVNYAVAAGIAFRYESVAYQADWLAGTGLYDHGPAIQAAVSVNQPVYLPAGTPQVRTPITCTVKGQVITGAGSSATVLMVPASFVAPTVAAGAFVIGLAYQIASVGTTSFTSIGASANTVGITFTATGAGSGTGTAYGSGVFTVGASCGEPGTEFQDFCISFVQPNTSTYGSLNQYPPGIYVTGSPRSKLRHMKIVQAITCHISSGNNGGAFFESCEFSHFMMGLYRQGDLDTVRVTNCHFWPFNIPSAAVPTLYYAPGNIGISSTDVNDLVVANTLFICGLGMQFTETIVGAMFATLVACDFDTNNGISMNGGQVDMIGGYFSEVASGNFALQQSGGYFTATGVWILSNSSVAFQINANCSLRPTVTCSLVNCRVLGLPFNCQLMTATTTSGELFVDIDDCKFPYLPQNNSPANPIVSVTDATANTRMTFVDNTAYDKGTGTGTFLSIAHDGPHVIQGNDFLNWNCALPSGATILIFSDNLYVTNGGTAVWASNKGTSSISSSTTGTVTHGVNFNGLAPPVQCVVITPTSVPPGFWYVSAVTTTTFTVTCAVSGSWNFGWQITNPVAN